MPKIEQIKTIKFKRLTNTVAMTPEEHQAIHSNLPEDLLELAHKQLGKTAVLRKHQRLTQESLLAAKTIQEAFKTAMTAQLSMIESLSPLSPGQITFMPCLGQCQPQRKHVDSRVVEPKRFTCV